MLAGILTCYNEMRLPLHQRAGPKLLDDAASSQARRHVASTSPSELLQQQSADDAALSTLLQRLQHSEFVSITQVNQILPRRLGFRSDQGAIARSAWQNTIAPESASRKPDVVHHIRTVSPPPQPRPHLCA